MQNKTIKNQSDNGAYMEIKIGENVIAGARSVLLPGVTGCVIGAMNLVTNINKFLWETYKGISERLLEERKQRSFQFEIASSVGLQNDSI